MGNQHLRANRSSWSWLSGRLIFPGIFWLIGAACWAQNLVPNPSFERYKSCPDGIEQIRKASGWYSANTGSPEYYNNCGYGTKARTGQGCAGLILHGDYEDVVEYLEVRLTDTLTQGMPYCVQFYARANPDSPFLIDKMGAYLNVGNLYVQQWRPIYKQASIQNPSGNIFVAEDGWVSIAGIYTAKGGESHLLIGNFNRPETLKKKAVLPSDELKEGWYSYYFIDDVSVVQMDQFSCCPCQEAVAAGEKTQEQKDTEMVPSFEPIYFEFDGHSLSAESKRELNKVIAFAKGKLTVGLLLLGHTDSKGTGSYNQRLSEKRVRSAGDYLLDNGLNPGQVGVSGEGEREPAASNDTDVGRAKNRRVDIVILSQ